MTSNSVLVDFSFLVLGKAGSRDAKQTAIVAAAMPPD
jgi:hypothetical protein